MKNSDIYKTGKYLQKSVERFPLSETPLSLAVAENGDIYTLTKTSILLISGETQKTIETETPFSCIFCLKNEVFASQKNTLYKISESGAEKLFDFPEQINALGGEDALYILTKSELYINDENGFSRIQRTESECYFIAQHGERICIANHRSIHRLEGKRRSWRCIFPEHSSMPDLEINCIAFDGVGYLLIGANEGFFIYDYKSGWYSKKELAALPEESVYSVCVNGGRFFLGTDAGAVLIADGDKKYLPATRFACSPDVLSVAAKNDKFYTASKGGITVITEKEMTLFEKAEYFFDITEKYFPRKDGYVTSIDGLTGDDISSAAPSRITDNDGLWSQCYITALSFAYAVTKDKKYMNAARRTKNAMLVLTRAPEIKGFTARAVRYPDEPSWGKGLLEQAEGAEWHRSSDGTYEWLGETSSDEMTGHFMGFMTYFTLCADKKEKEEIKKAVCDITDHILENNGYLIDCDGKPTTWACWNPEALNTDNMWLWEKGINSFQMLSFLKVSYVMSGDEKYLARYNELIEKQHFLINAAYHKREDAHLCHIDDLLGMCIALTLLPLEKDEAILNYLLMGLTGHWSYERIEGNPLYNFIYSAFTGKPSDIAFSVQALKEYPLDIISRYMHNSNRRGLKMSDEPLKWGEQPQLETPLSWDERPLSHYGSSAYSIDGGIPTRAESGASIEAHNTFKGHCKINSCRFNAY